MIYTKHVCVSRDINFVESVFPFKIMESQSPHLLFLLSVMFVEDGPMHLEESGYDSQFLKHCNIFTDYVTTDEALESTEVCPVLAESPVVADNNIHVVRPNRLKKVSFKFGDYTGLPSHLASATTLIEKIVEPQQYKEAVDIPE